ncbi:hypothetical protein HDU91_002232, partial [Kappamyces sp. JEL0680]
MVSHMMASLWTAVGSAKDSLQYSKTRLPTLSTPQQLLIRVRAASVSMGDTEIRASNLPFPMNLLVRAFTVRHSILGQEFAGDVEQVGEQVGRFKVGDRVFGTTGLGMGCHAQYIVVDELPTSPVRGFVLPLPPQVSYEQGAGLPIGYLESLHFLRNRAANNRVLIIGGAGAIGCFAIQTAKRLGATHITAVDHSSKLDLMASLGADRVVDYQTTPLDSLEPDFDLVYDVSGKSTFAACKRLLGSSKQSLVVLGNPTLSQRFIRDPQCVTSNARLLAADAQEATALLAQQKLVSVVDPNVFSLETA